MKQFTLSQIWDLLFCVILLPVVLWMGSELPGDWAHHQGRSLPGTATISSAEPFRGGLHVLVDVRDSSGQVVSTRHEINGEAPQLLGARFPVRYLPPDKNGATQVYVAGHDPFEVNAAVFVPVALFWLTTVVFVVARLVRFGSRALTRFRQRRQRRLTGPYRAGNGYTRE